MPSGVSGSTIDLVADGGSEKLTLASVRVLKFSESVPLQAAPLQAIVISVLPCAAVARALSIEMPGRARTVYGMLVVLVLPPVIVADTV
jgi:hypothetical protein